MACARDLQYSGNSLVMKPGAWLWDLLYITILSTSSAVINIRFTPLLSVCPSPCLLEQSASLLPRVASLKYVIQLFQAELLGLDNEVPDGNDSDHIPSHENQVSCRHQLIIHRFRHLVLTLPVQGGQRWRETESVDAGHC